MLFLINKKNVKTGDLMKNDLQRKQHKLFEIAEAQHGYFTAKQAQEVGYLPNNSTYHVQTGEWIREDRGIYRLKSFPYSQVVAEYAFYQLWTRDRNDKPQGVYSHETALSMFELSDLNPPKIHMTVPTDFRKSAKIHEVLRLYYKNLDPSDVQSKDGIMVTKPLATILDVIETGKTSLEFVEQALIEGLTRGLIIYKDIESEKIPKDVRETFQNWLKHSKQFKKAMGA